MLTNFTIMTNDVKTENENENIMTVCKVMRDNNIGCVVVVEIQNKEKIPVGIITERDIVNILGKLTIDFRTPLSSFMSKPKFLSNPTVLLGKQCN